MMFKIKKILKKIKNNLFSRKKKDVFTTIGDYKRNTDNVVVIGNGPSLTTTLNTSLDLILKYDRIAVNHFALSPQYVIVRPNIYVLIDPNLFNEYSEYKTRDNMFNALISNTIWSMILIVPSEMVNNKYVKNVINNNKNITVHFVNTLDLPIPENTYFENLDQNRLAPPSQTVLNTALYLAIKWRYQKVFIIGADSSFLADLRIDQDTNQLCSYDTHFYNNSNVYADDKNMFRGDVRYFPHKFHEELYCEYLAFKSYWDLKDYANYTGVKVYNASEYSWIDAFERKKLE